MSRFLTQECLLLQYVHAGQSTITFANRGEGLVVNEEDTFVKVCLQRNGSVEQLEQSETVYIQAKEIQPGTRMCAHIHVDVCTAAAACRELIVYHAV